MAIEAGAQLVEAAHNPDNLAACDRPRVRVTLVLDDWPRQAIDHLQREELRRTLQHLNASITGLGQVFSVAATSPASPGSGGEELRSLRSPGGQPGDGGH